MGCSRLRAAQTGLERFSRRTLLGLLPLAACARQVRSSGAFAVDGGFAEAVLRWHESHDAAVRAELARHPALTTLQHHRVMSGGRGETVLDEVLAAQLDVAGARRVLDWATENAKRLSEGALAARELLPAGALAPGRIWLVAGYDIGVAAPPDLALNVAHPHFIAAPEELVPYATHEAHHLGFLGLRPAPKLERLEQPKRLRELVHFFTQLEGMAVHAAYRPGGDDDCIVYVDPAEAAKACARYRRVMEPLGGEKTLEDAQIGAVLTAMSSGERLWYRVGALAARALERDQGREALVRSITNPPVFLDALERVLAR